MRISKYVLSSFVLIALALTFTTNAFAKGWVTDGQDWYYQDSENQNVTETIQTSNGKKYYLGNSGRMMRDYLLEDYNDATYYFNDDGEMVVNTWVAVDPLQVSDPITNGPTIYLYYFGANGKAYKAKNDIIKKTIDGKKYLFDSQGRMLSGWIDESGQMYNNIDFEDDPFCSPFIYYAGDETDGVLREGWMQYDYGSMDDRYYEKETIWFYFNPTSNKKTYNDSGDDYYSKKINGKTYSFDDNGVMLTGWEAQPATKYFLEDETKQEEYGSLAKKRWVYTIPSEEISLEDYQDERYRWFYSESSGDITKNQLKRIGKQYYAFDKVGIMRAGLVIFERANNRYVDTVDLDGTNGLDLIVPRKYVSEIDGVEREFDPATQVMYYFDNEETEATYGSRKIGTVKVSMAEKDWDFYSEKTGEIEGLKKKKYYQSGFMLQADPLLGLGIVLDGYVNSADPYGSSGMRQPVIKGSSLGKDGNEYYVNYDLNSYSTGEVPHFVVVDGRGNKYTQNNRAKKDKEGNYWIIGPSGCFMKAVTVPVKYTGGKWYYKSEYYNQKNMRYQSGWIAFGEPDAMGNKVELNRGEGDYEITPDQLYCVNFEWLR